jgi:hypothetical protein
VRLSSENANRKAKSAISSARSAAIGTLVQAGAGAAGGSFDIGGALTSNTGGIGNFSNDIFGTTLNTGGGGQIVGGGMFGGGTTPIPGRKPVGIG